MLEQVKTVDAVCREAGYDALMLLAAYEAFMLLGFGFSIVFYWPHMVRFYGALFQVLFS